MNAARGIEVMLNSLEKFLKTETVIGQPLELGKITLVPIISITFGIGSGGNERESLKGPNTMGLGGGAKISVDAMIVIKDEGASVIPIKHSGSLDKIMDLLPEIIEKFKTNQQTENKRE